MTSDTLSSLIKKVTLTKTHEDLAKLLSHIDRVGVKSLKAKELLTPKKHSFRIGLTGPPGAGKSTLLSALISEFRIRNMSVGVIAVDPSSPFTQGAILGDRIRAHAHFNDDKVFIRSVASRGFHGGLSAAVYLMLRAYDHFGFDVVIVETVGVGQTELEIMNVADLVTIVLVPESGDSIQALKAGLLEIADLFVVNKSDRPGADTMVSELKQSFELSMSPKKVKVFSTVATESKGVADLVETMIQKKSEINLISERTKPSRLRAEARSLLESEAKAKIDKRVLKIKSNSDLKSLF
ncbi:MAG: methylmalonyl Co-A mutase-associated GTPase MeaB [Pseudomonadota bacterium]|nr:methylmalonyl Co-A mutase-associated GTPase MeaB [Pseudomonadota bacterium]